jgi:tRNA(fMet)-specific endonuclease VapC
VAELYFGAEQSVSRDRALNDLRFGLSQFIVWPFDLDAAREYGRLYTELIRRGRPLQEIDVMIAAVALTLGNCTVVTTDSDPSAIPGLAVENWAA